MRHMGEIKDLHAQSAQEELHNLYQRMERRIQRRLEGFKAVYRESEERIFAELCFCICTPQSSAITCWKRIQDLSRSRILFEGDIGEIASSLRGVRFKEKKAKFIVEARGYFSTDKRIVVRDKLVQMLNQSRRQQSRTNDVDESRDRRNSHTDEAANLREILARRIKGLGMKEASHFLRNIGMGGELAILDRHILKNLARYGVIREIPLALSKNIYYRIEQKMHCFSREIGIPMNELDLLLWAKETGIVFK